MTMPESGLNVSASRADNSSVGRIETEAYLLANKSSDATVKRTVKVSAEPTDDATKIGDANTGVSEDAEPTVTNLKPVKSSIARKPLTEKQTTNFIGDVTVSGEEYFVTGSSYKGSWDALGMAGVGRYVMPHGTAYEGEIRDGMFHGQGSMYWPKNKRLDVVHLRGKLVGHRYTFEDGLVYQDEDWSYCRFPDRRFYESIKKGLRPGGRALKTAKQPTKVLPSGCYDAGDGAFDPKIFCVTSYDNAEQVLRVPTKDEFDWILENCRKSWTEPTGYRPSLNENWSENPPELPYHIAMSEDSPDPWWKRLTTFKRQFDGVDAEAGEDTCNSSQNKDIPPQEICLCGQYVILGDPCHCAAIATPFDDEDETEEINIALQSIGHSSDCLDVKSISQEECKNICIVGQQSSRVEESSAEILEFSETNTDHSASVSEKLSQRYFSEELVEKNLENREKDVVETLRVDADKARSQTTVGKKVLKKSAVDHRLEKYGRGLSVSKETIMKKLVTVNSEEIGEKLKYTTDHEGFQKVTTKRNEETVARREHTVEEKTRKEEEEFVQTSDVKKNRKEEEEKESPIVIQNEDQQDIDEELCKKGVERRMDVDDKQKDVVTKENTRTPDEEPNEAKIGGSEDMSKELLPGKAADKKNHNRAIASIRREKVPSVTEPETSDRRRMLSERSTLLPKRVTTERDLTNDRSNEKPSITFAVIDDSAIRETVQESNFLGSVSSKPPADVTRNVLPDVVGRKKRLKDAANDDKLHGVSSDGRKVMLDEAEETADTPGITRSAERYHRSIDTIDRSEEKFEGHDQSRSKKYAVASKASVRSRDESRKEAKFSELSWNDDSRPRLVDEEEMQTLKKISDSSSDVISGGITSKDFQSRNIDEDMTMERSSVFSKDDLPILEKLHHSLAFFSCENQKPTEEKKIIEIYRKCSTKEKSMTTECKNVNVWRLSGAAQNDSQVKMEDHLLHPTLAGQRRELVECIRKPCAVRVCKPTVPEVRTSASRCRKEFPFDIPAKQSRSSAERTGCRNK